jgi:alpha-amylase
MNRQTTDASMRPQQQSFARNLFSRSMQHTRRIAACLPALGVALGLISAAQPARADVILHAFNWRYDTVEARAAEIQSLGYKAVLVAPPLKSSGSAWWARYQPQDYRVIDHPLGDTEAFVRMSAALELRGLKLYADLVLNHMANEAGQRADLNFPGARVRSVYAADPTRWRVCVTCRQKRNSGCKPAVASTS